MNSDLCDGMDKGIQLVLINVYCPRNDPDNEERFDFKMRSVDTLVDFLLLLFERCPAKILL